MRVVIADDAAIVREGLARLLAKGGFEIVGEASDAARLLELVREQPAGCRDRRHPHAAHAHRRGPGGGGRIRERHPETGVLVLSQHLEPRYAMRLIEHTPSRVGYLLKERVGRVQELTDAIHRIDAGECVIDRAVVQELVERERRAEPLAELSEREREFLGLMAEGRSNQGIAERLVVTEHTVEKHVKNIFATLSLPPSPDDHRRVLAVLTFLNSR